MDTCAGDVLLLADEIATGWVEGVLVGGVEPKYFFGYSTKAYGWLDSCTSRLRNNLFTSLIELRHLFAIILISNVLLVSNKLKGLA